MTLGRAVCVASVCLTTLTAASCDDAVQGSYNPPPLAAYLEKDGWVVLPLPDNKAGPASVIQVTQTDPNRASVRWLGDFRRCGLTNDDLGVVRGRYPSIGVGEEFTVDANAALQLASVSLGPEVSNARSATLKINESGGDALDFIAFSIWMSDPANLKKLPQACTELLSQPNVFLVTEAFRITKGAYEFKDATGAKINLKLPVGTPLNLGAGLKVGSNGNVVFEDDTYFAVRRVKQVALGSFGTLGAPPETVPEADGMLKGKPVSVVE